MAESPQESRRQYEEAMKGTLDALKHVTTIAGAGVVALVAVYQEQLVDKRLLIYAVAMFGLSAAIAMFGLAYAVEAIIRPAAGGRAFKCLSFSAGLAAGALGTVVASGLQVQIPTSVIVLLVVIVVLVLLWAVPRV